LYAQNWLKIKTYYLFLNFDVAKGGLASALLAPLLVAPLASSNRTLHLMTQSTQAKTNALCSVVTMHLGSNGITCIAIFGMLSFATLKCERAFKELF